MDAETMIKAIIFDFDGVILNTFEMSFQSMKYALNNNNVPFTHDDFDTIYGTTTYGIVEEALKKYSLPYDRKFVEKIGNIKATYQAGLVTKERIFPGAIELLEKLSKKHSVVLASNNMKVFLRSALKKLDLEKYFKHVITSEDVANPKPNPEIFLKAASLLKLKPQQCLVLEDSSF